MMQLRKLINRPIIPRLLSTLNSRSYSQAQLAKYPKTQVTTLDNGLRVATERGFGVRYCDQLHAYRWMNECDDPMHGLQMHNVGDGNCGSVDRYRKPL
jgi:hypothetical protein